MKKFLLILCIVLLSAENVFAASMPRWSIPVLNVYIQQGNPQLETTVKKAFNEWQSKSNSLLKFNYRNLLAEKMTSQIAVTFGEDVSQNAYYETDEITAGSNISGAYERGYYLHINIKIRTKEADGSAISMDKLYSIALQAAGSALGVKCNNISGDVMSCNSDFSAGEISASDITALKNVYIEEKPQVKLKK